MQYSLESLKKRHRVPGILLDAQLLVLWIAGTVSDELSATHKRLAEYDIMHFHALRELLSHFPRLVTTPHILTEASNLATFVSASLRSRVLDALGMLVSSTGGLPEVKERHKPASKLCQEPHFSILGLADAAVIDAARRRVLVVSDDNGLLMTLKTENLAYLSLLRPFNQIAF
jgi:hypothetical protein